MMSLKTLLSEVRHCTVCAEHLPQGPRPVLRASTSARILIVGQAPGRKVHESGIPWDDASGRRLREWMGVSDEQFYDEKKIAIVPMGFCYPGTGKSGDLPPREECAPLWHQKVLDHIPNLDLTLLLSQYALKYYLGSRQKGTVTETVRAWKSYTPRYLPFPHPSPRNNIWLKKNSWFEKEVIPYVKRRIRKIL